MRKILILTTALTILVSGEAAAGSAKYSTSSTTTYNGITYSYSSSSTCADGQAALRLYRKWWCPVIASAPAPAPAPVAYSASVSWEIPSTRADGTPLPADELSGYEIYYTNDSGSVAASVPVAGGSTAATVVSNLTSGNYYFSIAAIDSNGLKSALSTMAAVTFP